MKRYLSAYHDRTRPAPAPVPQPDGALPPDGVLVDDGARVQCHVCGRWYGSLVSHIKVHGLDATSYKERYGLARGTSLLGPSAQAKQREAALARDLGALGRAVLQEIGGTPSRPRGVENRRQSRIRVSDGHRAKRPTTDDETESLRRDAGAPALTASTDLE